jgi:hypothetical protein
VTATIPCGQMSADDPTQPGRVDSRRDRPARARRLETWLWTGPVGHLLGGGIDFVRALTRYLLARARGHTIRHDPLG